MIVYQVIADYGEGRKAFRTLREARQWADEMGLAQYYIDRCVTPKPSADLVLSLLNDQGWALESKTVFEFSKPEDDDCDAC